MSITGIIDGVIGREGRYSDNPADAGGATMWGITEKVARAHGYTGLMRDLTRALAVSIYTADYVVAPGFDKIAGLSPMIGEELVDTAVNMGPGIPGPWLQRILNTMNGRGAYWPDLVVDGSIGAATTGALAAYLHRRGDEGERVMVHALNCLQGARYIEITEARPANEDFVYGWILNRTGVV